MVFQRVWSNILTLDRHAARPIGHCTTTFKPSFQRTVRTDNHFHKGSYIQPGDVEIPVRINPVNEHEFLFRKGSQQMNAESGVVVAMPETSPFRNHSPQIAIGITPGGFYRVDCRTCPYPFLVSYLLALTLPVVLIQKSKTSQVAR